MHRLARLLSVCLFGLAGCSGAGTINSRSLVEYHKGLSPPRGTPSIKDSVDGLIVGHRLMAAGEYELALKAYQRAAVDHGLNVDTLSAMGSANLRLGRLKDAEELLRLAVAKDERFIPAWNNLGVVLQNQGKYGEAKRVFKLAYALDNGNSEEIRANLTKMIAISANSGYSATKEAKKFELVRRGNGRYMLLQTPKSK